MNLDSDTNFPDSGYERGAQTERIVRPEHIALLTVMDTLADRLQNL